MEEEQVNPVVTETTKLRRPAFDVAQVESWEQKDIREAQERSEQEGVIMSTVHLPDSVGRAFRSGGNFAYQIYRQVDRAIESGPVDPDWKNQQDQWIKLNRASVAPEQEWRYRLTRNQQEADALVADRAKWARDKEILERRWGVSTFIAEAAAGIFDVDAPFTFIGGGLLTKAAKQGFMSTTAGRVLAQAGVAAGAGSVAGAGSYMADPNSDWTVIPLTGLTMGGFGAGFGALGAAMRGNTSGALNELGEQLAEGHPRAAEKWTDPVMPETSPLSKRYDVEEMQPAETSPSSSDSGQGRQPMAVDPDTLEIPMEFEPDLGRGSIGARQLDGDGPGLHTIQDPKARERINDAQNFIRETGIEGEYMEGYSRSRLGDISPALGKAAEVFSQALAKIPLTGPGGLQSDFNYLFRSNSAVAKMMAYKLLESSDGILRNNNNAARVARQYEKDMGQHVIELEDAFTAYAKENNAGWVQTHWNTKLRDRFNREVVAEMQARQYDGPNAGRQTDDAVKRAADALDRFYEKEANYMRGREGETSVHGAEDLKPKRGYMQQKWSGRNISRMIGDGVKRGDITRGLAEAYRAMHPNMTAKDSMIYAGAVINRAEKQDIGLNTSMLGLLQKDGRAELAETLRRNGMSENQIEKFIERMTGLVKERNKPGQLKSRVDVDARFVASNGIRIMDLLDTDLSTMMPQRARKSAGVSALARVGITSKADWDAWTEAIMLEQRARGRGKVDKDGNLIQKADDILNMETEVTPEVMDHLYAYFSGGALGGGLSPGMARLRKVTNLGLLNKLGLTQMYEAGNTIAAVGMSEYLKRLPEAVKAALKDEHSPLMQEMKFLNVFQPEERLFRNDLTFEFEKRSTQHEYLRGVDRLLNKGQQLQGYTSGFFHVRRIQQHIAIGATADRLARHFRDGGIVSDARLKDMGFDGRSMEAFKKHVENGDVEFRDGNLYKLNLDKWATEDREALIRILNARTDQLVMRALAGESSYAFHKDGMAQLFFHLKSFALMTMEKQFLRNIRLADGETAAQFMYGLGVTGALAMVRNTIDGRTDRNTPEQLARTALTMNHMTGWLPMWVDPVANLLGMDGISGFASRGDAIAPSAAITYANKAASLAALPITGLNGLSNSEINALTAIPLIGNWYGMTGILNAMKD